MFLFKRVVLVIGFSLGIIGFIAGAFTEYKSLGMMIFLICFFVGYVALIALMFSVPTEIAGRQIGSGNKIAVVGFGIIALSQLTEFLFEFDKFFGDIFFALGSVTMLSGIIVTVVRIAK